MENPSMKTGAYALPRRRQAGVARTRWFVKEASATPFKLLMNAFGRRNGFPGSRGLGFDH